MIRDGGRTIAAKLHRRRGRGATGRRALLWMLVLLGVPALLVAAAPLIIRGPVLARLVKIATRDRCGSITVEGGHFGWDAPLALLRQRPFDVALEGTRIREPDGGDLFRARTVSLAITVLRHPWRLEVDRAHIADGSWKMITRRKGEPPTVAFRRVPAGGRAACGTPAAKTRISEATSRGPLVTIRSVTVENVSLALSFPPWGLELDAIDAHGTLQVLGTPGGPQLLFDARDVRAKSGGALRIGPVGNRRTVETPFDRAAISRIAVTANAPGDLVLQVAEAPTGEAVLSGQAEFTNIIPPTKRGKQAGMNLDASWRHVGRALERDPPWAALGDGLARQHADLRASLHGPFAALVGTADLTGKGGSVRAELLGDERYHLDATFKRLDVTPLCAYVLCPLLGGSLDGRISVSAQRGMQAGDRESDRLVVLEAMELTLWRARSQKPTWVVTRTPGFRQRGAPNPSAAIVKIELGDVVWRRGIVQVEPFTVRAPSVTIAGRLRGQIDGLRWHASISPESRVTARGETFLLPPSVSFDGDPWHLLTIKPLTVRHVGGGVINFGGSVRRHGPANLDVALKDYPLSRVPALAKIRFPGRGASVGQLLSGQLDANLHVGGSDRSPELAGRVGFSDVRWDHHLLGDGTMVFHAIRDGTRLDGSLVNGIELHGEMTQHPRPQNFLAITLHDVPLLPWLRPRAAALGLRATGNVTLRPREGTAPGHTGPGVTADLAVHGAGMSGRATARLRAGKTWGTFQARLALASMQPIFAEFTGLHVQRAEGAIDADLGWQTDATGGPPRIDGTIVVPQRLSVWLAGLRTPIAVEPTRVVLDSAGARIARLALLGPGTRATLDGTLQYNWDDPQTSQLTGTLSATVDGARIAPWLGAAVAGSGDADLGVTLSGPLRALRLRGQASFRALTIAWPGSPVGAVRLDGPVAMDGRKLIVGPLLARTEGGGWILVAGPRGPGQVELAPRRAPLRVSAVNLMVRGAHLSTTRPIQGLSLHELGLALRVTGARSDVIHLAGEVNLGHSDYRRESSSRKAAPPDPAHTAARKRQLARIRLDRVQLIAPNDAIEAHVRYLPNVTVGLRCVVDGPLSSPRISGVMTGSGLYSRMALTVADWFTPRDLRKCDVGPH